MAQGFSPVFESYISCLIRETKIADNFEVLVRKKLASYPV